jgi:phage tail protein X
MTPRGALALALFLAAPAAGAVSLGNLEVRSALGDPLDARIAVTPGAGESLRGACFSLSRDPGSGVPRLSDAELVLQRSASGTYLRLRSPAPIQEPALALGIVIACPGQPAQETREYALLVDPKVRTAAPQVASRPSNTTLGARRGDTLESIATAIFPRNAGARRDYLAALRADNPALAERGDAEPIPAHAAVVLPDLRTFSRRARAPAAPMAALPSAARELAPTPPAPRPARAAPAPTREAAAPRAAAAARTPAPPPVSAAPAPAAQKSRAAPARAPAAADGFQLKLSGGEVDLSRSRSIDDRSRALLRERLLMLDADDQVAAMLSLRNSLRQLEARVAELQLKLAGMPASFAAGKPDSAPAKPQPGAPPPTVEPAPVAAAPAPKAEVPAPKVETPPPAPGTEPAADTPAPAVAPAPAARSESAPPPAEVKPSRAVAKPAPPKSSNALPEWLWWVVAVLVLLAVLLVWSLWRRRAGREMEMYGDAEPLEPAPDAPDEIAPPSAPSEDYAPPPSRPEDSRAVVASDAELATRIPGENPDELRRRYIEERFPEIVTRMIVIDDPDSVVKGARLFYEDGALPRAVELLQFAVEANPAEMKTWLALFEIFRLERLTGEFAALAQRFKAQHGEGETWRKVQYFGREIDPGNALYREEPINTLETIGPREARRLAAGSNFDPIAENWLNAPMDFQNEVLANELRQALLQRAGLTEEDLAPHPLTALRNVEMFTVA